VQSATDIRKNDIVARSIFRYFVLGPVRAAKRDVVRERVLVLAGRVGGRDREWAELMWQRRREIAGLAVRCGLGPCSKAAAPGGFNERRVDVDADDGPGAEIRGDGDGNVTVVAADVEERVAPDEGVWEAIEAELRAFFVVVRIISVDWSHTLLMKIILR
jgi:hypothetical protein